MKPTCVDRSPGSEAQVMNWWFTPPFDVRLQHSACVPPQLQLQRHTAIVNRSSPELRSGCEHTSEMCSPGMESVRMCDSRCQGQCNSALNRQD